MTLKGNRNHYNVKLLRGYGVSINLKDRQIVLKDGQKHAKFFYPSNVGKLDRENKDLLKEMLSKENMKAYKIFSKKYQTNLAQD